MVYEWKVVKLGTKNQVNSSGDTLENAVIEVKWKKTGTDLSGNEATYLGRTTLSAVDTSADSFVSLDSLTEETVINWVKATIDEPHEQIINQKIQQKIDKLTMTQRNPVWG